MKTIQYAEIENINQYYLLMKIWTRPIACLMPEKWWKINLKQGAINIFLQELDFKLTWNFRFTPMEGYEFQKVSFEGFLLNNLNSAQHD